MKCKNIECQNETIGKKVYCSLKCRNIHVNKYLRNYDKNKESLADIRREILFDYLKNPKFCKFCQKKIPFDKKRNTYCNSSCMASYTNRIKKKVKHNFSKMALINISESNKKRRLDKNYYENPKRCLNCNNILEYRRRKTIFCNLNCKKEYYSNSIENSQMYYSLSNFKFNLNSFKDEFDFSLIEENGWYKAKNHGDNMSGVSRDHMFSVSEGFKKLINPLLLSHPSNCKLMIHNKNQNKWNKCSISLDELLRKIEIFEEKYGKYYKNELKTHISLDELKELYMLYSYDKISSKKTNN